MPSFKLPVNSSYDEIVSGKRVVALRREAFDSFNPSALGLGDIKLESVAESAVAAMFDLQGFTIFSKQIEPHLSVPIYLSGFLEWIFGAIRKETIQQEFAAGVQTWHELPFFIKYMGDGLLVLWRTGKMKTNAQHNLITSCGNIIHAYESEFVPPMRRKVSDVPPFLRCGIAKGTVFSVGGGEDFVGSCINMASRLQRLASLSIAFSRRGFDPENTWIESDMKKWLLKKVTIRGIGDGELIYILGADFKKLAENERLLFSDP